ncbi:hypothetical protein TYRP_019688 [Tyrophagus putrescentiae]|nr:hypothetical protein TYRP_019688 [Tyrophagus putrescentiae]
MKQRIIAFLLFLSSHYLLVFTASNSTLTDEFTIDPLEANQNWEIAIRQVLLAADDATDSSVSTRQPTPPTPIPNESIRKDDFENGAATITSQSTLETTSSLASSVTTTVTSTSTSAPTDFAVPKVILEEEKEHDDDEDEEEKAESNTQPSKVEPIDTGEEDLSAEGSDEEVDNSSKGRADRMRTILQEAMAANQLKTIKINDSFSHEQVWSAWAKMANIVRQENTVFLRSVLTPIVMDTFYEVPDLSSSCASALMAMGTAAETEFWASQMIESIGRFPVGLLSGTSASFGDFDQCLAVKVLDDDQEKIKLQGKYCLVEFSYPVPSLKPGERLRFNDDTPFALLKSTLANQTDIKMSRDIETLIRRLVYFSYTTKIYNGICIPNACMGADIEVLIRNAIGNFMQLNVTNCIVKKHLNLKEIKHLSTMQLMAKYAVDFVNGLDQFQLVSLIIYGICSSLVALASILDWFVLPPSESRKTSAVTIYAQTFSVRCNWNRLFTVSSTQKYSRSNPDLRFINGIRVLTMLWIVFIHVSILGTLFAPMIVYRYEEEARPFGRSLVMQFIYNGYASVEVFFFISGFVLVFLTLRQRERKAGGASHKVLYVPPLALYAGIRAIRLLIPMIGILSLHFLWPLLGDGPVYEKFTGQLLNACRTNWWKNLLLVNNYDQTPDLCLVHTWFLSADFQLHLIAYPLVVLFSLSETLGILLNLALILAGAVVPAILHYQRHAPATLSAFIEVLSRHFFEDMKHLYYPVHIHLSSYFVGFLLDAIARILSTPPTQVLSRLSFSVYLVHILVVWYYILTTRSLIRFRLPDLLFITGGVLLYSLPLALSFHLIFEAPWSGLLKHCQQAIAAEPKSAKGRDEETEINHGSDYELYIGQCRCRTASEHALDCRQHKLGKNGQTLSHLTIQ